MKSLMNWMLAATLVCGASVLTSCSSNEDSPSPADKGKKDRKEFVEHARQSLKNVAENLNFKTWNSISYMNTYFNQYILLNDDFDKTISRAFGKKIQASLRPFEKPEWADPLDIPDDMKKEYKYEATVDLTDFNYTFTATTTGFDMAENDDQGLVVVMPVNETSKVEAVKVAIKGTGDTYGYVSPRLSNDSVMVEAKIPAQYNLSLSIKSGGKWTEHLYGTIKNTSENPASVVTPHGTTPFMPSADAWNVALDLHSNIPGVDAVDLYFAIGQDPTTHKAGLKLDYTHNGQKVLNATATLANANGMTDLSQMTSSSSIMDIFTAIMAGGNIEDLQLTLLDCLTTTAKVSNYEKVLQLQNEMARARRNYADQATIAGYVDQLNQLVSCTMSDKKLGQEIPMRLVTTKIGVDWWAVPSLNFGDENGYTPLTELLDKESLEYGLNIIDHAVDPVKNSIVVARQLILAMSYTDQGLDNFTQPSYLLMKSRCSVNFSFDDGLAADANIKAVFDEFGLKCGFAIISSDQRYKGYAEEGFEILAHNTNPLSSATESEIRASMQQGKAAVEGLGLICHGWVTPSSELPSALSHVTNDYFEYGFSVYKGDSATGQTMTENMKSYNLWRCHMNTFKENYQSIIADAVQNNGMVSVYGHANEIDQTGYWTLSDLRTILQYCKSNGIDVLTPYRSCLKLFEERHN